MLLNSFLASRGEYVREEEETGKERRVCVWVCVRVSACVCDCDKEQWRRMQNKASICFYNSELEQILMFLNFFTDDESDYVSSRTNWRICFFVLSFSRKLTDWWNENKWKVESLKNLWSDVSQEVRHERWLKNLGSNPERSWALSLIRAKKIHNLALLNGKWTVPKLLVVRDTTLQRVPLTWNVVTK